MKFFLFLFILTLPYFTVANTVMIACHLSNPKYTGEISLDVVGKGLLQFQPRRSKGTPSSDQSKISCPLVVHNIQDVSRGVSPRITLVFLRRPCQKGSKDFSSDIFTERIALDVDLLNPKPMMRVRWLKEYHPRECQIKDIRLFDLRLNARKFQEGKWPIFFK